jgi:hypothetical protein
MSLYSSVATSSCACLHFIHHRTPWILGFHHGKTHVIWMIMFMGWGQWRLIPRVKLSRRSHPIFDSNYTSLFLEVCTGSSLTLWPGPDPVWAPDLSLVMFQFGPVSGLLQVISVKLCIENVGLYLSITFSQGKFDRNCRLSEPIVGRSGFIRAGIEGIRASARYL